MYQDILLQSSVTIISEKHLFHGVQKRKGPLKVFFDTSNYKKFFWIFLTHRDEDFLHAAFRGYDKNKDGKISLEEFQRVMTRRWLWDRWSRFLIETNSHSQQHVEEADREYDDEGRLEWRRVSEFLSVYMLVSPFFRYVDYEEFVKMMQA